MFISRIQNGIDHLKDPIKSSILKDYLSEEQYNSFEENLNIQANKKELEKLLDEENKELIKITNYINKDYSKIYLELIILIKAIIDTLLLSYFDKIFKNIKEIKINENVNNQSIIIGSYNENIYWRGISFKNSISSYGYSYIINLFIKISKWILIFKFQVFWILIYIMQYLIIDIIFKEELERIIGIKSIEDLTNGKTDVEAYINNKAIIYYH